MNAADQQILNTFAERLRAFLPDIRIWAFGSRVYGTSSTESDLDVCVVAEQLDRPVRDRIFETAWQVGFENDLLISVVPYSRAEFENGPCAASPLVKTILARGWAA